jgi:hypothetical protein
MPISEAETLPKQGMAASSLVQLPYLHSQLYDLRRGHLFGFSLHAVSSGKD